MYWHIGLGSMGECFTEGTIDGPKTYRTASRLLSGLQLLQIESQFSGRSRRLDEWRCISSIFRRMKLLLRGSKPGKKPGSIRGSPTARTVRGALIGANRTLFSGS